jgi:hypothetical protein
VPCKALHPTRARVLPQRIEGWSNPLLEFLGKPDIEKLRPFTLTMPDNRYWAVGEQVGRAWSDGRGYMPADDLLP